MVGEPVIPSNITVHLGAPSANAPNVTVSFVDYIKNVASSEIYPTWPESALRANILAQISFALNRIYTEWYRSQGYDFDITNSTQYDQSFVPGRDIFENVSQIVDEIFNNYVRRQGYVEPYFTQYCSGTTTTCEGLSQWGTVELANQGYTTYDILRHYYGDNIDIVTDAPVRDVEESYPGFPLRLGDANNYIQLKQTQLNRISRNYPRIPKIEPVDGVFGQETEDAVKEFQRTFNLTPDGIIGKATWYRIANLYNGVKGLADLESEGIALGEIPQQYSQLLQYGDANRDVTNFQYFLQVVSWYYDTIPPITITGVFDDATLNAVRAAQETFGLPVDGIVGRRTWQAIYNAFRGIEETVNTPENPGVIFPGVILRLGSQGEDVELIQEYLSVIADFYPSVPKIPVTGYFGTQTQAAVSAFQELAGLQVNGVVSPETWGAIKGLYDSLILGAEKQPEQYPGYVMQEEA